MIWKHGRDPNENVRLTLIRVHSCTNSKVHKNPEKDDYDSLIKRAKKKFNIPKTKICL
jgi:hypothetical protein